MICLRVEKPRRGDDEKEKNKSTVENTPGRRGRNTDFFPRKAQISRLAWNESRQWRSNESLVRASSLEFFKTPDEYRSQNRVKTVGFPVKEALPGRAIDRSFANFLTNASIDRDE